MVYDISGWCRIKQPYHWTLRDLMDRSSEQCTLSPKVHGSIPVLTRFVGHGEMLSGLFHTEEKQRQKNKRSQKKWQTSKWIFAFASAFTQAFVRCEWALRMVKSAIDPGFPKGGVNSKGGVITYYLANLSRKLHEQEENWTDWKGEGGRMFRILLCRSLANIHTQIVVRRILVWIGNMSVVHHFRAFLTIKHVG